MSDLDNDYFEKILCYRSLTDSTYLASIVDYIKPKYFKSKNIAKIFEIINDFYTRREKLPTLTEVKAYLTTDEFRESFKQLVESFKDLDKNIDKSELYDNTERFIKEKSVYYTMLEVAGDIAKGTVDTSEILNKFETSCNISLVTDRGLDLYRDIDLIVEDLTSVQKAIPSTWSWFDEALNGGFQENGRALYVFAGETNVGKSIFLGNIASNIASQGKTVLVISLEMSEMIYAKRLSSNITKIPLKSLKSEVLTLKQQIDEISKSNPECKIIIKEFPPSTVTSHQIQGFIKTITSKGIKIDAIILDYINLLKSPIGINSYERVKYATEQIRALTYIFNCPIITATQLNRQGYDVKNPGIETIGESIGLAATADVIISIFQDEEDKELGCVKLGMMKNRFGPNHGTTIMKLDYSTLTVTEDESLMNQGDQGNITKSLNMFSNS